MNTRMQLSDVEIENKIIADYIYIYMMSKRTLKLSIYGEVLQELVLVRTVDLLTKPPAK